MLKSPCLFVCLCYFVVGSYGSDNLVPFIEKCEWSDQSCLLASTVKAMPYFAEGILGLKPLDPLEIAKATFKEGGFSVKFKNIVATGLSKCNILKVKRDIEKNSLWLEAECPIDVAGSYEAAGDLLLVPVNGIGPFNVNCESLYIAVQVELTTEVGKDGVKYWKIGKATHTYEARKQAKFHFENLYNGDQEKAKPVMKLMDDNWSHMMQTIGKPLVDKAVAKIVNLLRSFCDKVSADQLEK